MKNLNKIKSNKNDGVRTYSNSLSVRYALSIGVREEPTTPHQTENMENKK